MDDSDIDWYDPGLVERCLALVATGASASTIAATLSAELRIDPPLRKDQVQKRVRAMKVAVGDRKVGKRYVWRVEVRPHDPEIDAAQFYVQATELEYALLIDDLACLNDLDAHRVDGESADDIRTSFLHLIATPEGAVERAYRRARREQDARWEHLGALGNADDGLGYMDAWIAMTPTAGDDIRALATAITSESRHQPSQGMDATAALARALLVALFEPGQHYWEAERLVMALEHGASKVRSRGHGT